MVDDYSIALNFLRLNGEIPSFRVYRRERGAEQTRPDEDTMQYSLPMEANPDERQTCWVRFSPYDGFTETTVSPTANAHLTRRACFAALCASTRKHLDESQFNIPTHGFTEELALIMVEHEEGQERLVVQPYYLRAKRRFGYLVDFHFRLREGIPFSRRIQQLSLSLDKNYRRNLDCYIDRHSKIKSFLEQRRLVFQDLQLPGASSVIAMGDEFESLGARRLRTKVYLCGGGRDARSQFTGLREHGPLEALQVPPTLLFAFRERDRQAARTLAIALRGSGRRERYGFPGFVGLFKHELKFDADPIVLPDLSLSSFSAALVRVKRDREKNPGVLPVFVLPEGDDNGYMEHKATFAHEGIPTQVCTTPVIQDDYSLKWSIANIALQIFCKAGGQPWKVRPTVEKTLIIGISQSHKVRDIGGRRTVEKYFAFSVMTDNSGLFQKLQVLGEAASQQEYLLQLGASLRQILDEGAQTFSRVVIHTSFKLKRHEMDAIRQTVAAAANAHNAGRCGFAVVKLNHKSRFFGINRNMNSLVPFEATTVRLGGGEHLIWFEGIFPDKPTVNKAYPGPTHVTIFSGNEESEPSDDTLLQDLVNLSGANWRGFNAKSAPVSVFYCHLVADLVHDFHDLGLPLPRVQDLRPWFL